MAGFNRPEGGWNFVFDGLNTNDAPDALQPTQYPYARNVRRLSDRSIRTRPGYDVLAVPPSIPTVCPITPGRVGTAYSYTLTATGGTTPYVWTLASGSLPTGLTLSSSGVISGTPATPGNFTWSARVTDAAGLTALLHCSTRTSILECQVTVRPTAYYLGCRTSTFGIAGQQGAWIDGSTSFNTDYNASNTDREHWWNNDTALGGQASPGAAIDGNTNTYSEGRYARVSTFFEYRKLIVTGFPAPDPLRTLLDVTLTCDAQTIFRGGSLNLSMRLDVWNTPGSGGEIYTLNETLPATLASLALVSSAGTIARTSYSTTVSAAAWNATAVSAIYGRAFLFGSGAAQPPINPQQSLLVYDFNAVYRYC